MEDQEPKQEEQGNPEVKILIYLVAFSILIGLAVLTFDGDYTIQKNQRSNQNYYREFE